MPQLTREISQAWEKRNGPVVLTTMGNNGQPNAIYATCVGKFADDTLVVADNYFSKTRANILAGSPGSILFITADSQAYQIKGRLTYHRSGPIFEFMKSWNPARHPGHAAVALHVEEAYKGAEKIEL